MAQVLTFTDYSPARFAVLEKVLDGEGLRIDSTHGEVKKFGAHVDYDEESNVLTLTVENPPHFERMNSFCDKLDEIVNGVPE